MGKGGVGTTKLITITVNSSYRVDAWCDNTTLLGVHRLLSVFCYLGLELKKFYEAA